MSAVILQVVEGKPTDGVVDVEPELKALGPLL
jgi:hypothetical protein